MIMLIEIFFEIFILFEMKIWFFSSGVLLSNLGEQTNYKMINRRYLGRRINVFSDVRRSQPSFEFYRSVFLIDDI